jgi:SAM-dependent methyltransferase
MTWEDQAENWLAWARTPGHDAYWYYRDALFPLLPPPGRRTLEIGCGEGRVVRDLVARGHRVVGVDSSPTLLRHAAAGHVGGRTSGRTRRTCRSGRPSSTWWWPTTR